LIEYALRYITEDRDRWDQDNSVPELVTTLVRQLTNHQASYCFGNFIALCVGPNHGKIILFNEQQTASESIQYNTLNAAAELKLSQVANAFLLTCTQDDPHAERKMPLMISVQKGLPGATRLILGLNVDKDAKDNSGRTALHYAVEREDEVIVKLLVEQGAQSRIPDRSNVTALTLSLKKFRLDSKGRQMYDFARVRLLYRRLRLDYYPDRYLYYSRRDYLLRRQVFAYEGDRLDRLPPIVRLLYEAELRRSG